MTDEQGLPTIYCSCGEPVGQQHCTHCGHDSCALCDGYGEAQVVCVKRHTFTLQQRTDIEAVQMRCYSTSHCIQLQEVQGAVDGGAAGAFQKSPDSELLRKSQVPKTLELSL